MVIESQQKIGARSKPNSAQNYFGVYSSFKVVSILFEPLSRVFV